MHDHPLSFIGKRGFLRYNPGTIAYGEAFAVIAV